MGEEAAVLIRVAENGRLSLPSKQRRALGLEGGGLVSVRVEDGEIRIRTARAIMMDLQDEARRIFNGCAASSDALLQERCHEAARDA